jgi:DNA-binding MarR family transcriptional regulator
MGKPPEGDVIQSSYAKRNSCTSIELRKCWIALRMQKVYHRGMNSETFLTGTGDLLTWDVASHMIRLVRAMHELERCDPKHASGLSMQQLKALLYLTQTEGSTVKDLAHALSVSEARASRLADELTVSGHVLSDRNPSNRRQVRLQATSMGASKANRVFGQRIRALQAALQGMSERDTKSFLLVFDRIIVELETLAERSGATVEGVPTLQV